MVGETALGHLPHLDRIFRYAFARDTARHRGRCGAGILSEPGRCLSCLVGLQAPGAPTTYRPRQRLPFARLSASIMTTSSPDDRPQTLIAWSRYGRPITIALPVPPAPTTRMRTGFLPPNSAGSVCSMRMLNPLSGQFTGACRKIKVPLFRIVVLPTIRSSIHANPWSFQMTPGDSPATF